MRAIGPRPVESPGGNRGSEAVASPRHVIDRKPVQAPGGTRGNTVLPSGQGPDKAPGGSRGSLTHQLTVAIGDGESHGIEMHGGVQRPAESAGLSSPENHRPGAGADLVRHDLTSATHNDGQHRARLGGEPELPASNPSTRLPQVFGRKANRRAAQRVGRNVGQARPRGGMIRHPRAMGNAGGRERCHTGQIDEVESSRSRQSTVKAQERKSRCRLDPRRKSSHPERSLRSKK